MMDYDIPAATVSAAVALTPGIESPTVSPLHREGWVAVRAMVPTDGSQRLMDQLYAIGARGSCSPRSMPADSDMLAGLPRTWRPLGPRIVAIVLVIGLGVVCATSWIAMGPEEQAKYTTFQLLTLAFIALLILTCIHALTRSRVTATRDHLIVVNGYKRRDLEWAQVIAIRLPSGAPWVRLDLSDGEEISAMGIQSSDGGRAKVAVRELRRLADASAPRIEASCCRLEVGAAS